MTRGSKALRFAARIAWQILWRGLILLGMFVLGVLWSKSHEGELTGVRDGCIVYYPDGSRSTVESPACARLESERVAP